MAYHHSTPPSVLDAPQRTRKYLVEHTGHSRVDRRHTTDPNGGRHFIGRGALAQFAAPVTNTPFVRSRPDQASRARRRHRRNVRVNWTTRGAGRLPQHQLGTVTLTAYDRLRMTLRAVANDLLSLRPPR